MLKGNQKKLDKNNNNRIDSQDFKLLRGGKKRGGLFYGYSKVFDTAAKAGEKSGTSTIVGVKPNPKKAKKTFKSMAEMRKAKGFKAGETAAQFNKRKAAESFAKKAARATGARGKIALGVAAAGVGAIQYLKNKMKKNKEKKAEKKMGGGMMQRPMGYKAGGPLGSAGRGLGRAAGRKAEQKRVGQTGRRAGLGSLPGKEKKKKNMIVIIGGNSKSLTGKGGLERDANDKPYRYSYESDPMLKNFDIKYTERMGGGMMNKPMGYKAGKSVKVKCKLGKNKPTKMY